jgi:excisionase family DNA binding protein
MNNNKSNDKPAPLKISVRQATELAPFGVTTLYKLIGSGKLKSSVVGRRRLIDYKSFTELINENATDA